MLQWNPLYNYSGHPWEQNFGRYIGVAFIEGLFCTLIVHLGPGFLHGHYTEVAFIQGWPLRGVHCSVSQ